MCHSKKLAEIEGQNLCHPLGSSTNELKSSSQIFYDAGRIIEIFTIFIDF